MSQKICVFIAANFPRDENFTSSCQNLAKAIAERDLHLVYGGSQNGLMGVLADSMIRHGGQITGIMSHDLAHCETVHDSLDELIYTDTINQRKKMMMDSADAFIAFPGGVGTLEEFFDTWCAVKIGTYNKPIGLLNINGFFDPLCHLFDNMLNENFINESHRQLVSIESDAQTLLQQMGL